MAAGEQFAWNGCSTPHLRVVLLGGRNSGKSALGNVVLGKEEFVTRERTTCSRRQAVVAGRRVTVVDAPGWWCDFSARDTAELVRREIAGSVFLCPPGPHVFLVVVKASAHFSDKRRRALEDHVGLLGEGAWRHCILVLTGVEGRAQRAEEEAITRLLEKCGRRRHSVILSGDTVGAQATRLLVKMQQLVSENDNRYFEMDAGLWQMIEEKKSAAEARALRRFVKMREQRALLREEWRRLPAARILLVGAKGSGKSSAANTILGREGSRAPGRTARCAVHQGFAVGREVTVVDTPGWWMNYFAEESAAFDRTEIVRGVSLCPPGPHGILLAVRTDRAFTETYRRAVEEHMELMGRQIWTHVIVLFSIGDWLGDTTIEQYIESEGAPLRWLIEKCRNMYHIFNNKTPGDGFQVGELMGKIEEIVASHGGRHYEAEGGVGEYVEEQRRMERERAKERRLMKRKQRQTSRRQLASAKSNQIERTMNVTAWTVLNEMRLEGGLCDVVITVDDVEFNAHKIVLSACSDYFRALFTGSWAQPDKRIYSIPGVSADIMRLLLDYAYTSSITVTMENVLQVLVAADYLSMLDLLQLCCDFLQNQLCPENCIGIWRFADIYSCTTLKRKAYLYMLQNIEEMVRVSKEFLELTLPQLAAVIEEDKLNVEQESVVFEAVLCWINHRAQERSDHMAVLLPKIRLGLMTESYLINNVKNNALVKDSTECKPIVTDALKAMYDLNFNGPSISCFSNPLTRPRLPRAILLAIGGWSAHKSTNGIEAYDARANRWVNVTKAEENPRAGHGAAFLNGFVYCLGGFDDVDNLNSVRKFDLVTRAWHQVAPMHMPRRNVSVAVLDGCIYAMGGFDGHMIQNTAERYEPEANQWTLIAPMHKRRSDANATTLHGKVYICGGFKTVGGHMKSAEYYNPATNQWTLIRNMTQRRRGLGVIAYGDRVYAVGGFHGIELRSVEAYNPVNNTWRPVSSMSKPRRNFGLEVVNDLLFVVGGFNGFTNMLKVECYDEKTNQWSNAKDMGISRRALSCCVVQDLPNMEDYAAPRNVIPMPDNTEGEGSSQNSATLT